MVTYLDDEAERSEVVANLRKVAVHADQLLVRLKLLNLLETVSVVEPANHLVPLVEEFHGKVGALRDGDFYDFATLMEIYRLNLESVSTCFVCHELRRLQHVREGDFDGLDAVTALLAPFRDLDRREGDVGREDLLEHVLGGPLEGVL